MRMWMTPPALMCRQHLLGEHLEIHMLRSALQQGTSLTGYVDHGLVQLSSLWARHEELSHEMEKRGYKHESPLRPISELPSDTPLLGTVDQEQSLNELITRCPKCRVLNKRQDS